MARIDSLNRLDPPPVNDNDADDSIEYGDISPELKRWLSDVTDILNAALQTIEDAINAIP